MVQCKSNHRQQKRAITASIAILRFLLHNLQQYNRNSYRTAIKFAKSSVCDNNGITLQTFKSRFFTFVAMRWLWLCFAVAFAQQWPEVRTYLKDPWDAPRKRQVDFQHLQLKLSFKPQEGKVIATATHSFQCLTDTLSALILDAPYTIKIKKVLLDNQTIHFKQDSFHLYCYFPIPLHPHSKHTLIIDYEATPHKGIYFIGWNYPQAKRKQIWTQGQAIDNRYWIPMYDGQNDKITTETIITFDSSYQVLSNGTLLEVINNGDGTKTWHYKMQHPHAPYLIMLAIGKYRIKRTRSSSGVPMQLWYYPDHEAIVPYIYEDSEKIMDFLEQEIGIPYPWESYSQVPVQDFLYGAMENTTATIFGDFFCVDSIAYNDRNYISVNAHELTHQWFGDYVTARSLKHHWLQESFATYYAALYIRHKYGDDEFRWRMRQSTLQAIKALKQDVKPVAHSQAGSIRHYPQGARVLDMLRYVVGDSAFRKAIQYYLKKHPYDLVDSEDLWEAFYAVTGKPLLWFWEQWIYHNGIPHYKVQFQVIKKEGQPYGVFYIQQIQKTTPLTPLFKMPVQLEIHYENGGYTQVEQWIEEQSEVVWVPLESEAIAYVLFDPNDRIMKQITFPKPYRYLANQLLYARHAIDRYDAAVALRTYPLSQKKDLLLKALKKEPFFAVQAELLAQLAKDKEPSTTKIVHDYVIKADVRVQKHFVQQFPFVPQRYKTTFEVLLQQRRSYELIKTVFEKLCDTYPPEIRRYIQWIKDVEGFVGKNVKITVLLYRYLYLKDKKSLAALKGYTSPWQEFRTRMNAIQALEKAYYLDRSYCKHLIAALFYPNPRLANVAGAALKAYWKNPYYKHLIYNELKAMPKPQPYQIARLKTYLGAAFVETLWK